MRPCLVPCHRYSVAHSVRSPCHQAGHRPHDQRLSLSVAYSHGSTMFSGLSVPAFPSSPKACRCLALQRALAHSLYRRHLGPCRTRRALRRQTTFDTTLRVFPLFLRDRRLVLAHIGRVWRVIGAVADGHADTNLCVVVVSTNFQTEEQGRSNKSLQMFRGQVGAELTSVSSAPFELSTKSSSNWQRPGSNSRRIVEPPKYIRILSAAALGMAL